MARSKHYSPEIRRFLVSVLYHEAQERGVPMTVLTNETRAVIDAGGVAGEVGWQVCVSNEGGA